MTANPVLLQMKYASIIAAFCDRTGSSTEKALDFFYHSVTFELIREGVSDLHCMSDDYLAEMLEEEMKLSQEEREKQLKACKKKCPDFGRRSR